MKRVEGGEEAFLPNSETGIERLGGLFAPHYPSYVHMVRQHAVRPTVKRVVRETGKEATYLPVYIGRHIHREVYPGCTTVYIPRVCIPRVYNGVYTSGRVYLRVYNGENSGLYLRVYNGENSGLYLREVCTGCISGWCVQGVPQGGECAPWYTSGWRVCTMVYLRVVYNRVYLRVLRGVTGCTSGC